MTYVLTFENGRTVISFDLSYVTVSTFEKMFNSKITHVNGQKVY